MSKSKQEPAVDIISKYLSSSSDMPTVIGNCLTVKDELGLLSVSKNFHQFFYTHFHNKAEHVVEGNVIPLIKSVEINPRSLFVKHPKIVAPRGQIYFDVSYYQLMTFLCDDDMKAQIMSLDGLVNALEQDANLSALRKAQYKEIDCGGADLVKLDRDPFAIIAEHGLAGLTHFKTAYIFFTDNKYHPVTFPLLENRDGIFCHQDEHGEKRFYYVNPQNEKPVQLLEQRLIPEESKEEFEQFKASFDEMENNSGRRSSIKEHQLLARLFGITLVQKGILYEANGIQYRDYRTPFNLINAYRKCIRLYNEAQYNNNWEAGDTCWYDEVGKAQGEEVWLLQRICEKNRPFYPLDKNHKGFKRESMINFYNADKKKTDKKLVLENGVINILDFALYKGRGDVQPSAQRIERHCAERCRGGGIDLVALCWLIEKAKENVKEFDLVPELQNNYVIT